MGFQSTFIIAKYVKLFALKYIMKIFDLSLFAEEALNIAFRMTNYT